MTRISLSVVAECLAPFHDPLTAKAMDQIRTYVELLQKWNRKISLTTITDTREILSRHFGESIFAHSNGSFVSGRLADVGSGAGFPGLALKIAAPDATLALIEPNMKKCGFLAEVVRELELSEVEIVSKRFQDAELAAGRFDVITARALGEIPTLLTWGHSRLAQNGKVLLWLGKDDAVETSRISGWDWAPVIQIPQSERRVLLSGVMQQA